MQPTSTPLAPELDRSSETAAGSVTKLVASQSRSLGLGTILFTILAFFIAVSFGCSRKRIHERTHAGYDKQERQKLRLQGAGADAEEMQGQPTDEMQQDRHQIPERGDALDSGEIQEEESLGGSGWADQVEHTHKMGYGSTVYEDYLAEKKPMLPNGGRKATRSLI
jgi:hypothetical protein